MIIINIDQKLYCLTSSNQVKSILLKIFDKKTFEWNLFDLTRTSI
jgi:hypothetical protein